MNHSSEPSAWRTWAMVILSLIWLLGFAISPEPKAWRVRIGPALALAATCRADGQHNTVTGNHALQNLSMSCESTSRGPLSYPWPEDPQSLTSWDGSLEVYREVALAQTGTRVKVGGYKKFSPLLALGWSIGGHHLSADNLANPDGGATDPWIGWIGNAEISWLNPTQTFQGQLLATSDNAYKDLLWTTETAPPTSQPILLVRRVQLNWTQHWSERWRLRAQHHHSWLSDDNTLAAHDLATLYGLSLFPDWVWLGIGLEYRQSANAKSNYWSPRRFMAAGPRVELTVPLNSLMKQNESESPSALQRTELSLGLNLNHISEDHHPAGYGYALFLGARYGARHEDHWQLSGSQIESQQGAKRWQENLFRLSYQRVF